MNILSVDSMQFSCNGQENIATQRLKRVASPKIPVNVSCTVRLHPGTKTFLASILRHKLRFAQNFCGLRTVVINVKI